MTESSIFDIVTVLTELIQLNTREVVHLIQINYRDSRPIYEQIKDGFRKLILTGVLLPDERMPSVRELATNLAINPNTIQRAYRELEQEGYICSVPGKGSFVSDTSDAAAMRRRELLNQLKETCAELSRLGVETDIILETIKGEAEHD